jgi:8-oxo-dGTP pyrophosphatase MutT (NUDIX family)
VTNPKEFRRWADAAKEADEAKEAADERGRTVSELIPAATVILVRDGADGLEALMLRRNSTLAFAGGMWVFPGGRLDPSDHAPQDDPADVHAPYRRAAVREALEEADVVLDHTTLIPFSHWEPPPISPKRFSTWFFIAAAPTGVAGEVAIDQGEIHDHAWMRPADALRRRDQLDIELAPPTWITLFELADTTSVADALHAAASRTPEHFATKIAVADGDMIAVWHGDAGYGDDPETHAEAPSEGPRHRLLMLDTGWRYERTS